MELQSSGTESLCPHCLRRIPASRVQTGNCIYLEKSCPEHGPLEPTLLWKDTPWTYAEWNRSKPAGVGGERGPAGGAARNCPDECGICPNHRQSTCTAILEVTRSCGLHCPVCFAASGLREPGPPKDPNLGEIEEMLQEIRDSAGICPIQLSGGEPTLRNDLPEIVALARKTGFDHVQINTNGLRLAQDQEYARSLKDAGTADFFLQFDGITDEVYSRIRGAALMQSKVQAIERCAALEIGVILVPTLVRSVNESQIGAIIQFAKKWIPTVKGVHFQPMTYLGRYPSSPRNEDRILIPEILTAIEEQTEGELLVENMLPSG